MPARLLTGREPALAWREETQAKLAALAARGVATDVAVVRVGDDASAVSYAKTLAKVFAAAGVAMRLELLAADSSPAAVADLLARLNADSSVAGIMLQEPVPSPLSADDLALLIAPDKDIDGVHPDNAGWLFQGRPGGLVPATAYGGLELLDRYQVPLAGRRAVVVGRSTIVGRPMALLLLHRHATVTVAHSRTPDLAAVTRQADVLVAAVGRAGLITPDMVAPGATVVDFGINFQDGRLCGDVAAEVADTAGEFTPTPGGTGAMTGAALLANLATAAARRAGAAE